MEAKGENGGDACDVCSSSSPNKLKTITVGSSKKSTTGLSGAEFPIDKEDETDDIVPWNVSGI